MNLSRTFGLAVLVLAVAVAAGALMTPSTQHVFAANKAAAPAPEAVEDDMHEFMEYVFQPSYKRLKPAMAAAPADNSGWKAIKAESLLLAEGGNLIMLRTPDKGAADWNKLSAEVRSHGKALYAAGRKKDFETARTAYMAMLKSCNQCHKQFANGEHQLKP